MWKKQDSSTDRACRRPSSKDGLRHQSTLVVLVVFFIFFTVTFLVLTVFSAVLLFFFLWYSRFDGLLAFLVTVKYDDDDGDDFKHKSDVTLVARARFHSPERCR